MNAETKIVAAAQLSALPSFADSRILSATEREKLFWRWQAALLPLAREAIERGDFAETMGLHIQRSGQREHYARIVASYAAHDILRTGETKMLDLASDVEREIGR